MSDVQMLFTIASMAACGIFLSGLAVWNGYLLKQNKELVDKLMSRNYAEYAQGQAILKQTPEPKTEDELVEEPYDKQRARELNGLMGMG